MLICCGLALASLRAAHAQEVVPPDRPISLQEAQAIAYQNQGSVATSEETVNQARQRVRIARAGTLPLVTGAVSFTSTTTSDLAGIFGTTGLNGGSNTTSSMGPQPAVQFSQTIFDAGLTRLAVRQARAGVVSASADLKASLNNLGFLIATDFLAQLRAQALLAVDIELVRQSELQLQSVLAQIQVGALAMVERFLPESQLENAIVTRIAEENALRVAAAQLRDDMGLPPGPPLRLVEPVEPARAGTLQLPPLPDLEVEAMQARPEVVAAESTLRSQNLGVSLARLRRTLLPTLTLNANVAPRSTVSKASSTVLATASVPLWDAGVGFANEQIARSAARSAAAVLEQTKKDVASQVDQAYYNYVSALQRVTASQAAVDAAAANVEAVNERFRLGAAGVSVVDLVVAQAQYAQAQENLVSARYDVIQDLAQLYRALGR